MSHLDPELLAAEALGEHDALTAPEREHLAGCAECRSVLAELVQLTELARRPEPTAVDEAVLTSTWSAIRTELDADPVGRSAATTPRRAAPGSGGSAPASANPEVMAPEATAPEVIALSGRTPGRTRSRSRWLLVAAAAVVGVLIGVVATSVVQRDDVQVVGSTTLAALPGHSGTGTAELVIDHGQPQLRLQVEAPDPGSRFRQVWLINNDQTKMFSLGVLPNDGSGNYPLPPELAGGLQGFDIVDVSIEPYDGNPLHSHDSQVRGVLPT